MIEICELCEKRIASCKTKDNRKVCHVCARKYKKESVKINLEHSRLRKKYKL